MADYSQQLGAWVDRSRKMAQKSSYLDDLHEVYPIAEKARDALDDSKWQQIRTAHAIGDPAALVSLVLSSGHPFPVNDSYVAFLRRNKEAIDLNPKTTARLAKRLFDLTETELRARLEAPPEPSRMMGQSFRQWIRSKFKERGWAILAPGPFRAAEGPCLLDADDAGNAQFAVNHLGLVIDDPEKGLDFVLKRSATYVVGEAKFLSDKGGSQTGQFKDAMRVVAGSALDCVVRAAVLDGVVWLPGDDVTTKMLNEHTLRTDAVALSALLLTDLVNAL